MSSLARLLGAARRRLPRSYWRARNAWALGEWVVTRLAGSPYDAAFYDAHAAGDWDGLARTLLRYAPGVRRAVDVGCGDGNLLDALRRMGPALELHGLEASPAAVARARERGLDVALRDLALGDPGSLDADLAVCLEVAEHLPPWRAGALVRLLATAPVVIFSAAQPNQGGVLHVNEQPPEYWLRRFARRGMRLSPLDAQLRGEVAALALPPWYASNIHLLERAP